MALKLGEQALAKTVGRVDGGVRGALGRVLVLGATSGIGRALVLVLRAAGIEVVGAGRRRALLESLGGETLVLDVTAADAIERIAGVGADTVIFNAGFGERSAEPDWGLTERALGVNVLAFERVAQWAAGRGACRRFVAVASIAGIRGLENTNGYSASKAYMLNAMEGYRRRWRLQRVGAEPIVVVPGFVDTVMGQASTFWRCSPEVAACCILKGLQRGRAVIYVTGRWRWMALLLRFVPRGLFERIRLK